MEIDGKRIGKTLLVTLLGIAQIAMANYPMPLI